MALYRFVGVFVVNCDLHRCVWIRCRLFVGLQNIAWTCLDSRWVACGFVVDLCGFVVIGLWTCVGFVCTCMGCMDSYGFL